MQNISTNLARQLRDLFECTSNLRYEINLRDKSLVCHFVLKCWHKNNTPKKLFICEEKQPRDNDHDDDDDDDDYY